MKKKLEIKIKNYVEKHEELKQDKILAIDLYKASKELDCSVIDLMCFIRYGIVF